jgi:hypothetical protein
MKIEISTSKTKKPKVFSSKDVKETKGLFKCKSASRSDRNIYFYSDGNGTVTFFGHLGNPKFLNTDMENWGSYIFTLAEETITIELSND